MKKFLFLGVSEYLKIVLVFSIFYLKTEYHSASWYASMLFWLVIIATGIDVVLSFFKNLFAWQDERKMIDRQKIEDKDRKQAKLDRLENKKFRKEYRKKESSQILLNKLIQKSLIKEKEILSVAKTCQYYQLIVYSYSYASILSSTERKSLTKVQKKSFDSLKRLYPDFLGELGFVRIGTRSGSSFVVNKNSLAKKLRDISLLKKHLMVEFQRVREEEWNLFLNCLKSFKGANKGLYSKYSSSFDDNYLPINFLLTESLMNAGHIGFVNNSRIGIAPADKNDDFLVQLLAGTKLNELQLEKSEKVNIKDFFKHTDICFLLDRVDSRLKAKLEKNEIKIKKRFEVGYILDFANVNKAELKSFFGTLGIDDEGVSDLIVDRASEFKDALDNLHVQID